MERYTSIKMTEDRKNEIIKNLIEAYIDNFLGETGRHENHECIIDAYTELIDSGYITLHELMQVDMIEDDFIEEIIANTCYETDTKPSSREILRDEIISRIQEIYKLSETQVTDWFLNNYKIHEKMVERIKRETEPERNAAIDRAVIENSEIQTSIETLNKKRKIESYMSKDNMSVNIVKLVDMYVANFDDYMTGFANLIGQGIFTFNQLKQLGYLSDDDEEELLKIDPELKI